MISKNIFYRGFLFLDFSQYITKLAVTYIIKFDSTLLRVLSQNKLLSLQN